MNVLVTGAAGFIGYHVCQRLLARGDVVVGVDNVNDYYDTKLKEARLGLLCGAKNFHFVRQNIADAPAMRELFAESKPQRVVNLAAQAGVRYSLVNPQAYVDANLQGFLN
ncbi:MAG TPA: GDP-mannose 4,6-dehydratase, partial [Thermoanaerobaculia bacterium]|nr:GDP-mannose 4,6-dehydratase [Thermoanaerobaculia bacterium]